MSPSFVRHRVNTIAEVASLDAEWGAEIDLRSDLRSGSLHLSHDAFKSGDGFEPWLEAYRKRGCSGPLIVNTKEDGLETAAMEILRRNGIDNYFFLDTTLPTLVRWTLQGETCFAVRVSQYEPASGVLGFVGRASWAWVDCFGAQPLSVSEIQSLSGKFRLCLVSPELQGGRITDISKFHDLAKLTDTICTKDPAAWQSLIKTDSSKGRVSR